MLLKNKYIRSKIKKLFFLLKEFLIVVCLDRNLIPIRYFSAKPNVGDALNVYLIRKISGRETLEIKSGYFRHILGIGSIMHFGTKKSIVWGSGIIKENQLPEYSILKKMNFSAVRGVKTRNTLEKKLGESVACPLGDPAVLMSLFYFPRVHKEYSIGVVPHYMDKNTIGFKQLLLKLNAHSIDVELPVEDFINDLVKCDVVFSSSLHGLILSDTYNIPNLWVKFSDKIIGGNFKFEDYYSTTNSRVDSIHPIDLSSKELDKSYLEELIYKANISEFTEDKKLLLDAFPFRL